MKIRSKGHPWKTLGCNSSRMWLQAIVNDLHHEDFFFVQIGAGDGDKGDVVSHLAKFYKWHGLLVETNPESFKKLIEKYAGIQGLMKFVCAAVASQDGPCDFYVHPRFPDRSGLAITTPLQKRDAAEMQKIQVQGITVPTLLTANQVKRVDFLCIDCEGADQDIIMAWPFDRLRPAVLEFENTHMAPGSQALCKLVDEHYVLFHLGPETIGLDRFQLTDHDSDILGRLVAS